jgi:hypothetical protein
MSMWNRRTFGWIGVAGVLVAIAGGISLFVRGGYALLVLAGALLLVAAVGGWVARSREAGSAPRPLRGPALAALACTAATVLFAWGYASQQPGDCDTPPVHNDWTAIFGWGGALTGAAAFLLGIAGLAARRWFVALIAVFVNPAALLYAALSTGALC